MWGWHCQGNWFLGWGLKAGASNERKGLLESRALHLAHGKAVSAMYPDTDHSTSTSIRRKQAPGLHPLNLDKMRISVSIISALHWCSHRSSSKCGQQTASPELNQTILAVLLCEQDASICHAMTNGAITEELFTFRCECEQRLAGTCPWLSSFACEQESCLMCNE